MSIGNCLTSFYAGFAIFSGLGYLAKVMGKDVKDVAVEGRLAIFEFKRDLSTLETK